MVRIAAVIVFAACMLVPGHGLAEETWPCPGKVDTKMSPSRRAQGVSDGSEAAV